MFRALRTFPVICETAREPAELSPNAWLLNYTNPMAIAADPDGRGRTVRAELHRRLGYFVTESSEHAAEGARRRAPAAARALDRAYLAVCELAVRAYLEGRREWVYHACVLDPGVVGQGSSLERIWAACDELFEAHGELIPDRLR